MGEALNLVQFEIDSLFQEYAFKGALCVEREREREREREKERERERKMNLSLEVGAVFLDKVSGVNQHKVLDRAGRSFRNPPIQVFFFFALPCCPSLTLQSTRMNGKSM